MRDYINIISEMEGQTSKIGHGDEIYFSQSRYNVGNVSLTLAEDTVTIDSNGAELSEHEVIELLQYLQAWYEDGYGSTPRSDRLRPRPADAPPRDGDPNNL